jgi:hypothetical protein
VNVADLGGLLMGASPSSSRHPLSVRGSESLRGKWEERSCSRNNEKEKANAKLKEKQKKEMN